MPSGCPGCKKLSETRFVIADASTSAKIDFHQSAKKMIERKLTDCLQYRRQAQSPLFS